MANFFPLIINPVGNIIQELPANDLLDLSQSGIANSGNITVSGVVSATGNITGDYFIGNGSLLTGIDATSIQNGNSNVRVISSNGNVTVGIDGNSNIAVFASTGLKITGSIEATNGFIGLDATAIANGSANVRTFENANVTVSAGGNANVLTVTGSGADISGTLTASGNANVGNLSATTVAATTLTGTLSTAAQTNITSVGTLSSLGVSGNATAGNFVGTLNGSGANVTNINASNISSGTLNQARLANAAVTLGSTTLTLGATVTTISGLSSITSTTFVGALTGAATTAGTVTTAAQPNITSVGTMAAATITTLTTASITKSGTNAVGNIGQTDNRFNNVFARASSASYADLAEIYLTDSDYPAGTVVVFGGAKEVTESAEYADTRLAGVISTNPAFVMNDSAEGQPIALQGRVPCSVVGNIQPGDLITTSNIAGVGTRLDPADWRPGTVLGKALTSYNSDNPGTIEVVVGRV
jgi:hypothetical protein